MTFPDLRETPGTPSRPGLELYELAPWRSRFGVVAGITSRSTDFTLGGAPPTGDPAAHWDAFRALQQARFPSIRVGYQCHGTRVAAHQYGAPGLVLIPDTDGHVTEEGGVLLGITVADCIPVYLTTTDGAGVGLLHVGWRGLASGIIEQGVPAFRAATGGTPSRIVSHCGVGICGGCYEVGPEVVRQVLGEETAGPTPLDLRAAVALRLTRLGVPEVTLSPWCTAHDAVRFHSHRASGGRSGRMLAFVGRPLA
ncbi:MAG TPA: polyphenol oxidase family protein [Gemmatimonadales bacterium]